MTVAAAAVLPAAIVCTLVFAGWPSPLARTATVHASLPPVEANDNQRPAGTLRNGRLTLELRAADGLWTPETSGRRTVPIQAFGEGDLPLSSPGPLIRVPEGTIVEASVRNQLALPLRVYGLCDRTMESCPPLEVPPFETRRVEFSAGSAGTYHYWATTTGMPQNFRALNDSQLGGAFIVDPAEAQRLPDRILVISEWTSLTPAQLKAIGSAIDPGAAFLTLRPDVVFSVNGRSWPDTERLTYRRGQPARWHVVNLSTQLHPMHLHGFYFEVEGTGDGLRMLGQSAASKPLVVTHPMTAGSTMVMNWTPERVGNWLFHCHVMTHISPTLHVDGSAKADASHQHDSRSLGMTGMVLGVTVIDPEKFSSEPQLDEPRPRRTLTLTMQEEPGRFGDAPALGFVLEPSPHPAERVPVPGPPLLLTRGEPVEITLINKMRESTAIHWHGMELESFYDGAHGFSGAGHRLTPMIEPGASFVVRFTPPRAGTFIYHTHQHDRRQLTSGLYGAMLVTEPGEPFDPEIDHVFVIGRHGPERDSPVVLNGERNLQVSWKAGARHRVRLINITPDDNTRVKLQTADGPFTWRPVAKDGAQLPPDRAEAGPANAAVAVGETYDFEVDAPRSRRTLWLEVTSGGGRWLTQGHVVVR